MLKKFHIVLLLIILLTACKPTDTNNNVEDNNEKDEEENVLENSDENQDTKDNESNDSINAREEFSSGDDAELEAEVELSEENNQLTVKGETNLLTDTPLTAELIGNPMGNRDYIDKDIHMNVQENGTFETSFDLDDNFFQENNEQLLLFTISYDPLGSLADEHIKNVYGKNGEHLEGPFVRNSEMTRDRKQIYASKYIVVGDHQTKHMIEADFNKKVPDDYGKTEIWAEAEIVGNDHYHIYVEGRSNIIEGTQFLGRYYSDQDHAMSQNLIPSLIEVDKYGDFTVPIRYDSITDDGYVELNSYGNMRNKKTSDEIYGENYENISGDIVEDGLTESKQIIRLTLNKEGMDIKVPDESIVTEEDGELKIAMPDDVLFGFDESNLMSNAKETLKEVIDLLENVRDNEVVLIKGHTDNEGDPDYNQNLSEERARAVEEHLKDNGNLEHLSFKIEGYGETKPVASNDSEEGRSKNRRVEIIFKGLE